MMCQPHPRAHKPKHHVIEFQYSGLGLRKWKAKQFGDISRGKVEKDEVSRRGEEECSILTPFWMTRLITVQYSFSNVSRSR